MYNSYSIQMDKSTWTFSIPSYEIWDILPYTCNSIYLSGPFHLPTRFYQKNLKLNFPYCKVSMSDISISHFRLESNPLYQYPIASKCPQHSYHQNGHFFSD